MLGTVFMVLVIIAVFLGPLAVMWWRSCRRPTCSYCYYPLYRCECDPWELDLEQNVEGTKRGVYLRSARSHRE